MPELNDITSEVTGFARDAAYVAVGLGVLGVQKLQVQRNELRNRIAGDATLEGRLAEVRAAIAGGVAQVDDLIEGAVRFLETTLEPVEEQLPPAAREVAHKAHAQARELRAQLRERITAGA